MSKDKKPKNPVKDKEERWISYRMYRGESWFDVARRARLSYRNYDDPSDRSRYLGFRIVKNIPKDPKEKKNE